MTTLSKWILAAVSCSVLVASSAQSKQATGDHPSAPIYTPQSIEWKAGPPALPSGSSVAVLEGDPQKEGPFTMRVRFPDGYKIPPHTHPSVEHVTVISGTFNFGMGEAFDQAATQEMPAGTFGFWPAGMKHFAWAKGETVVQIHGIGPWGIQYLNPADDPRTSKSGK